MKKFVEFTIITVLFLFGILLVMYKSKTSVRGVDLQTNRQVEATFQKWNTPFCDYFDAPFSMDNQVFTVVNRKMYIIKSSNLQNRLVPFPYRDLYYGWVNKCIALFCISLLIEILIILLIKMYFYLRLKTGDFLI